MTAVRPPDATPPGGEDTDVELSHWLSFTQSRAQLKAERRAAALARLRQIGMVLVVIGLATLAIAVAVWRPGPLSPDKGDKVLGKLRTTALFMLADDRGVAVSAALLAHDPVEDEGAIVVIPTGLSLVVAGSRQTIERSLPDTGPTLTRDAVADLLSLEIAGSWVIERSGFIRMVDTLGGVDAEGRHFNGADAFAAAASGKPDRFADVLRDILRQMPDRYTASRDLLTTLGVLGDAGLSLDRLSAVLAGLSRDIAGKTVAEAILPVQGPEGALDAVAASPLVRDVLGGQPRTDYGAEITPRVLVHFAGGDEGRKAAVRALIVNGGFEYEEGPAVRADSRSQVRVRNESGRQVGESVALTLGLDGKAVSVDPDLPGLVDVVVVVGKEVVAS